MKFTGRADEFLQLERIDAKNCEIIREAPESSLTALWFTSNGNTLIIDGQRHTFDSGHVVFLTEFHKVEEERIDELRLLRFNRPFYCILTHDDEVGCKGILFFGASQLPVIIIPEEQISKFETLWDMFTIEMESRDNLQIGMLQMMLKRFLILSTRLYKEQETFPGDNVESDLIREFNFLVEQHFRDKHTVAEYAEMLYKSPKTLSNVFSKMGSRTPLQLINDRKLLEARRLLRYTDRQVQEIAYEIGYKDVQTFSRFFKRNEGMSPSDYREESKRE